MPSKYSLTARKKRQSRKLMFSLSGAMLALFALIAHFAAKETTATSLERNLASIGPAAKVDHEFLHKKVRLHKKIRPPINVKISNPISGPVAYGQPFTLVAEVSSDTEVQNAVLSWQLPQWVKAVDGSTSVDIPVIAPGTVYLFEITLISNSEENQQVHASLAAPVGEFVLSTGAQYNTTLEDELRESTERLVQRNLEYMESQ